MADEERTGEQPRRRRRYDSPLRRKRAAQTRERIIAAGAELLHDFPVWNWHALTVRAVAERAGVNERTVYRHFENEVELREAVMGRHQEEAGVDFTDFELDELPELTTRLLEYISSFPVEPRTTRDPTLIAAGNRHRQMILAAVAPVVADWDPDDRVLAAAMLDVLRSVGSYERLVADWKLEPQEAIRGVIWALGLMEEAIRNGRGPRR